MSASAVAGFGWSVSSASEVGPVIIWPSFSTVREALLRQLRWL
jgi:hypothetical protein